MYAHATKGWKEGRTWKMHDTNCGCLDRHSTAGTTTKTLDCLELVSGQEERPMSQSELNRFRAILTARTAELERLISRRDGIVIERSADQLEEIQWAAERAIAVHNLDREFGQLRNARA